MSITNSTSAPYCVFWSESELNTYVENRIQNYIHQPNHVLGRPRKYATKEESRLANLQRTKEKRAQEREELARYRRGEMQPTRTSITSN